EDVPLSPNCFQPRSRSHLSAALHQSQSKTLFKSRPGDVNTCPFRAKKSGEIDRLRPSPDGDHAGTEEVLARVPMGTKSHGCDKRDTSGTQMFADARLLEGAPLDHANAVAPPTKLERSAQASRATARDHDIKVDRWKGTIRHLTLSISPRLAVASRHENLLEGSQDGVDLGRARARLAVFSQALSSHV